MYSTIINPINGKIVKTNSKQGQVIIEKYKKEYFNKIGGELFNKKKISASIAWTHDMIYNLTPYYRSELSREKIPCIIANQVRNFHNFGDKDHIITSQPTLKEQLCSQFVLDTTDYGFGSSHIHNQVSILKREIWEDSVYYDYEYKLADSTHTDEQKEEKNYHQLLEDHSKGAFHKNWKIIQRYKQLTYAYSSSEPHFIQNIDNFFMDGDAKKIISFYFSKLYTPVKDSLEYEEFKEYFRRVAVFRGSNNLKGILRRKYYDLMEHAERLSFEIYLDSTIPRNCTYSKGFKKTEPELFEKSSDYTLNDDIKNIPHNFLRMYYNLFLENGFFDRYHEYWKNLEEELKETTSKRHIPYSRLESAKLSLKKVLPSKENRKLEKLKNQLQIYNKLESEKKLPPNSHYIIDNTMPFSDENIRDMEDIFYKTGLFFNKSNSNLQITRFDERVWKLFWQLGHQHGMYDIHFDNEYYGPRTDKSVLPTQKQSIISGKAIFNTTANTAKAVVGAVTTGATALTQAISDIAQKIIDINSANLNNLTTALLRTPIDAKSSVNNNHFTVGEPVALVTGNKGIIDNSFITESGKLVYEVKVGDKKLKYLETDIRKIIDYNNYMEYYEIAHYAGYYYALADNFYYQVTTNDESKEICKNFRLLSIYLNSA